MIDPLIAAEIRAHIVETRPADKRHIDFTDGSSLVATGVLDSVGVFTLIAFLEQRFDIEVRDDELQWKYFESVDAIARLVEAKRAGRPEPA
jgi:acyl carrier protein